MGKGGYVYIITNDRKTVLYTGVTSNLARRIYEHKTHQIPGFAKKYTAHRLVYYEVHDGIKSAIAREKYIKGKTRAKKIVLIENQNKNWIDLSNCV